MADDNKAAVAATPLPPGAQGAPPPPAPNVLDILSADETGAAAARPSPGTDKQAVRPALPTGQQATGKSQQTVPKGGVPAGGSGPTAGKEGASEPVLLSQDEIDRKARAALGLRATEPETVDHWRKKYEASSREAHDLLTRFSSVEERLKGQGLRLVMGASGPDFVVDGEQLAPKAKEVASTVFASLSQLEKESALENPEQFASMVISKALAAAQRPVATVGENDARLGPKEVAKVREGVIKDKGEDGKPRFPDFEALEPYMIAILEDKGTPPEFLGFMNRSAGHYEFGLSLLYGRVQQAVAPLIAQQRDIERQLAEKKRAAQGDASLSSEGRPGGVAARKTRADGDAEAHEIVKAKPT